MSRFTDILHALVQAAGRFLGGGAGGSSGGTREIGPPASANGASSFHLRWELPTTPLFIEVSAVLEIVEPPKVGATYFWALQVDFVSGGRVQGGAHTGLQWNRRYPGGTAVNWGGYASQDYGGSVLSGSVSELPGFPDDPHTLGYSWQPRRPYLLRVYRSPDTPGAWRAAVTDTDSGSTSVIRDLFPPGGRRSGGEDVGSLLARPLVWSEVFADCDAPSVTVRWSDFQAVEEAGNVLRPSRVQINYQSVYEGGCTNTNVVSDGSGVLQVTNATRTAPQGTWLDAG